MSKYQTFPNTVSPIHPGVYQRLLSSGIVYNLWKNGTWYVACRTAEEAAKQPCTSFYQHSHTDQYPSWRGLAKKPDAP